MPGVSIATDPAPARGSAANTNRNRRNTSRSPSPTRPPISPITPTLGPASLPGASAASASASTAPSNFFARDRPVVTHSQPNQTGAPLPGLDAGHLPPPISLDDNPDALALKSAISILQLQRARAERDIKALSRAKDAALADPAAFIADLQAGRVGSQPGMGSSLFAGGGAGDDDSDSEGGDGGEERAEVDGAGGRKTEGKQDTGKETHDRTSTSPQQRPPQPSHDTDPSNPVPDPSTWRTLPRPQDIIRCPPINWAQYAVVGDSLDKLHAEQQRAPVAGSPGVLMAGPPRPGPAGGAGGNNLYYEFPGGRQLGHASALTTSWDNGGGRGEGGDGEQLVGVAAPYNPVRDKVEKKGKGGRK